VSSDEALKTKPGDFTALANALVNEYLYALGIRGDCSPESAAYLGYLDFKTLYPQVKGRSFESMASDVIEGKSSGYITPNGWSTSDISWTSPSEST
jgi:hypothetical protein